MRPVLERLLRSKNRVATSRGETTELNGVLLKLANPRARLSRSITRGKVFSCLGELLWYLSKTNSLKYITYYLPRYTENSDDNKTVYGAYGPRLFNLRGEYDQVSNLIATLRAHKSSRRAVIQLFDASDVFGPRRKEIPCTCTLQFMVRKERLEMFTSMRSNDAFTGLPHDIFSFTMLQEMVARSLGLEVGFYKHAVGSLHLYETDVLKTRRYLDEGFQSTKPMPPMPIGDPWTNIRRLVRLEASMRSRHPLAQKELERHGYWADLARLLEVFRLYKANQNNEIPRVKKLMSSRTFNSYIRSREAEGPVVGALQQLDIPFPPSPGAPVE